VAAPAGGGRAGEFFTALGAGWRLSAAQQIRLVPAVTAALESGWTPRTLAAFTGANTDTVRNSYAVLVSLLSPAELPPPRTGRPPRPPWCGECDQTTRMLGFDGDAPPQPIGGSAPRRVRRNGRFGLYLPRYCRSRPAVVRVA